MNIFVVDENPEIAARSLCDKHVCKLLIESGQMLCAAHPVGSAPWKRTHYNHPCTIWARSSTENYRWLAAHGLAICEEYTRRYGRRHKSEDVVLWCAENIPVSIPIGPMTPFAVVIKDPKYRLSTPVESYRAYYLGDKIRFARWRHCDPPQWWTDGLSSTRADCPSPSRIDAPAEAPHPP